MKSKYKGVYYHKCPREYNYWRARLVDKGVMWDKICKTEREAAIAYDMRLIELGREPVNILKRK